MKLDFKDSVSTTFDVRPESAPYSVLTGDVRCIKKGWGRDSDGLGEYFAFHKEYVSETFNAETVKLLFFAKGKRLSRHFHVKKEEYFVLVKGQLKIEIWDGSGKEVEEFVMEPLHRILIKPGVQHRMTGLEEENILLEISTLDSLSDSYRIEKGD